MTSRGLRIALSLHRIRVRQACMTVGGGGSVYFGGGGSVSPGLHSDVFSSYGRELVFANKFRQCA